MKRKVIIMCIDLDLFGQVIVTLSDVELWLENSRFTYDNNPNRVKAYIKNYDIANKIAKSKLSGEFYNLEKPRKDFDQDLIRSSFIQYVEPPAPTTATGCPLFWHRCDVKDCPVYQKNKKRDYSRDKYKNKKAERQQWLADMTNKLAVNA